MTSLWVWSIESIFSHCLHTVLYLPMAITFKCSLHCMSNIGIARISIRGGEKNGGKPASVLDWQFSQRRQQSCRGGVRGGMIITLQLPHCLNAIFHIRQSKRRPNNCRGKPNCWINLGDIDDYISVSLSTTRI